MGKHRQATIFDVAHRYDYNPETGTLHEWGINEKPSPSFIERNKHAPAVLKHWRKYAAPSDIVKVRVVNPEPAGKPDKKTGALVIYAGRSQFYAHSIVWLKCFGGLPEDGIVHLNGDRTDNRIENLELVTEAVKSRAKPYRARVRDGKRLIHLGYFASREDRDAAVFAWKLGLRENT